MGRLTLNVLLSFAQFEREVTGERIRDKFAASKKKGMWMGGIVPYGYRLENRKLLIDPPEAHKVRQIFELYLEIKSLPKLAIKLAELSVTSRPRRYGEGRTIGGQPFRTGALSHLLSNRVYVGDVRHHKQHFPGEQEAILDKALFEAVQTELAKRLNRRGHSTHSSGALLKGLLFDSNGNRMVPTHARKQGVRYCYYQSWVLAQGQKHKAGVVSRVPAQEIEQVILKGLRQRFPRQTDAHGFDTIETSAVEHIERIDVLLDALKITFKVIQAGTSTDENQTIESSRFIIPWTKLSLSRRKQISGQDDQGETQRPMRSDTRSRLLKGIAQGSIWLNNLNSSKSESIQSIAKAQRLSEKTMRSTISLALLAPDIVEAAIDGRLPRGISVTQMTDLPGDWHEQRKAVGMI